ncbi:unnamed protein product [Effrenium voratum]|uniref:CSD domain-containing protein n=1 Tax=Effrenium voratum TaxID=2562239 RepID=A0AA36HRU9_9DINO|nr:unnamed protein product [Effrenium voratum]
MKRDRPPDEGRAKRARNESYGQSAQPGQPAVGTIVNYYPQKGYGFLKSNVASKDVFFPKAALPPEMQDMENDQLKGIEMGFNFSERDGKPRAERLERLDRRSEPSGRPMSAPPMPPVRGSAGGRPPPFRGEPEPRLVVQTGVVRSYDAKKGFGFIQTDHMGEDAFYLRSELPPELAGIEPRREQVVDRRVEFEVRTMPDGKIRAERIAFLPDRAPERERERPDRQAASSGQGYRNGRIRNFYLAKGYGFIEVPGHPDVFFLPSSLPKDLVESNRPLEGLEITFEAYTNEEGKPRARHIQPLPIRAPPPPQAPPRVHMAPPSAPVVPIPAPAPMPLTAEPKLALGTVANYDPNKGFGFLKSETIPTDVFFQRQELPLELREEKKELVGKLMEFEVKKMRDGKLRARKLLHLKRGSGPLGPRARGRVIKYHKEKGYGFIDCDFANNVFFLRSSLPKDLNDASLEELKELEISFELSSKEPGKPRASHLEILGRERLPAGKAPQEGEILSGEIVAFEPGKGYGFVKTKSCEEDVYFIRAELPPELSESERREEVVGEHVEFELQIMSDGKLRAQRMVRNSPGDESDLEEEVVQEMTDYLAESRGRQDYGKFTNRFPRVKKPKIQKHFEIITRDGRAVVALPPDHPQREDSPPNSPHDSPNEVDEPIEELPDDQRDDERDMLDDFPEDRLEGELEVDPNEPSIPLGPGVQPLGIIRDYDAGKGYGFIRCEGLEEDVFFPRQALPKSFQGQNTREMPELKGVQVSFDYNPSHSRGPRSDTVTLLLSWLQADRCWLLKRAKIPPGPPKKR